MKCSYTVGITWGGPFDDFPEEKGWDNIFNVNVKSIFYSECFSLMSSLVRACWRSSDSHPFKWRLGMLSFYARTLHNHVILIWSVPRLTELLSKDAHNFDPGRVINISSTASVDPRSESALSQKGNGTWSYQPSKAAGEYLVVGIQHLFCIPNLHFQFHAVNHLTSQLALKLGPRHVTYVCPRSKILTYLISLRNGPVVLTLFYLGACIRLLSPSYGFSITMVYRVFPSKMTAFGLRTAGDEVFIAHQPTGKYTILSPLLSLISPIRRSIRFTQRYGRHCALLGVSCIGACYGCAYYIGWGG